MVSTRRRANGFTLLELLMVIAILGVVLAIAVPSIRTLLNTQKMKSATFDIVTTAMFARSEAMKWSGASSSAISIAAPSNNFNNGWCIMFTTASIAAADYCSTTVVASRDTLMQMIRPTSGVAYYNTTTATTAMSPITFARTGRLTASVRFLVVDTDASPVEPRCVTIDTTGNATVRVLATGATSC